MNARWLTDLDVFNEWMNEEDYELADTDGSVSFDLFFVFLLKYYLRELPCTHICLVFGPLLKHCI